MFGQKYDPRKMTLEKPLVGRFRLPRVRPGGKAPNRELSPKSEDITCMGYKTFFKLNSVEHEILNARKYKDIKIFSFFRLR